MDKARQVLGRGVPPGVRRSYRTLADHGGVPRSTLHRRDHGGPSDKDKADSQLYLKPLEESALVKFILHMSDLGQPVRIKYIPALAFVATRVRPPADRPLKPPGKNWPKAFEKRHPEIAARRVTALDWNRHETNIAGKMTHWFEVIGRVLRDPAIRPENFYNMDETGVMLSMLGSVKVLVGKDDKRKYRGARVKRTTVTAIECISADGRYLNPLIIWPATTHQSNWTIYPTPGWQYGCSESGYTDSHISLELRVLICDGFGSHETLEVLEFCLGNNIILCRLPSHTSHKLQPCDVAVFAALKAAYRDEFERLERGGVNAIGKEHFTSLYSHARSKAFTQRNIRSGFSACGLFPFDPDRVLQSMPKPPPELTLTDTNEVEVVMNLEDTVQSPITPVTPVTTQGIALLQNTIIKQATQCPDPATIASLRKNVQKMSKAAHLAFSKGILQRDQIQFLMKMNDESKVRKSAKGHILGRRAEKGEGAVLSWNELEVRRAGRAEQAAAAAAKSTGKRGGKRKGKAGGERQAKVARPGDVDEAEVEGQVPSAWRAPEAPILHNRRG
ncbi:hypothetical protein HBH51_259000 [Parastagonospora nodorum]|nr:hypothetical protein HBH51_259000 [Parastagonospora nodorum]